MAGTGGASNGSTINPHIPASPPTVHSSASRGAHVSFTPPKTSGHLGHSRARQVLQPRLSNPAKRVNQMPHAIMQAIMQAQAMQQPNPLAAQSAGRYGMPGGGASTIPGVNLPLNAGGITDPNIDPLAALVQKFGQAGGAVADAPGHLYNSVMGNKSHSFNAGVRRAQAGQNTDAFRGGLPGKKQKSLAQQLAEYLGG